MIEWWRLWQTSCNRVAEKQLEGGRLVASVRLKQGASLLTVFLVDFALLHVPTGYNVIYSYAALV